MNLNVREFNSESFELFLPSCLTKSLDDSSSAKNCSFLFMSFSIKVKVMGWGRNSKKWTFNKEGPSAFARVWFEVLF